MSNRIRRHWPVEEKLKIVLETLDSDVSVPVVARRYCLNANQLFSWRRQYQRGELVAPHDGEHAVKLLAVQVDPATSPQEGVSSAGKDVGVMEMQLSDGPRLKIWGRIQAEALRIVVQELLRSC